MTIHLEPGKSEELNVALVPKKPSDYFFDGVKVDNLRLEPAIIDVGGTVQIILRLWGPTNVTYPINVEGNIHIGDEVMVVNFTMGYPNPTISFPYVTTKVGTFTVQAGGKSATLVVTEPVVGCYSPWGGARIPLCVEVTIPDVDPFLEHPGGDLILRAPGTGDGEGGYAMLIGGAGFILSHSRYLWPEIGDKVHLAYPSKWFGGTVQSYNVHRKPYTIRMVQWNSSALPIQCADESPWQHSIWFIPTAYSGPPYWNSKEEVAQMVYRQIAEMNVFVPAMIQEIRDLYYPDLQYIYQGISGVVKPMTYDSYPGWEKKLYMKCPYCNQNVGHTPMEGPYHHYYTEAARRTLLHIEEKHPQYPLSQPAPW